MQSTVNKSTTKTFTNQPLALSKYFSEQCRVTNRKPKYVNLKKVLVVYANSTTNIRSSVCMDKGLEAVVWCKRVL